MSLQFIIKNLLDRLTAKYTDIGLNLNEEVIRVEYKKCESSYYQPFYEGDTLVYKVVASPY